MTQYMYSYACAYDQEGKWTRVEFRHISSTGKFLVFVVINIRGEYTVIVTKEETEPTNALFTEFALLSLQDKTECWGRHFDPNDY